MSSEAMLRLLGVVELLEKVLPGEMAKYCSLQHIHSYAVIFQMLKKKIFPVG